ncbi:signal peptidase I [Azohydromonas caseinilytica]|uniref:Signal peptidase I n=1 Tax=Azohydromonas caseinilytica TaxID=2728836 RepID=A0A848F8M3_9BURK|nr:signal peptidase I [Azohydromonas caseinilytica]NML15116.1 signal peptidase I [Azohydromonas caseinilytica]
MNPLDLNLRIAVRPQPVLAALKSLVLPGLGQWHNGQIDRAVWWFLAFALLSVPSVAVVALWLPPAWTAPALAAGLLLTLGVWVGSIVDAWRMARRGVAAGMEPLPGLAAGGTPVWRMAGVTLLLIVLCDLVALPLLIMAVRAHVVAPYRIPSASMAPALWPGDFIFADKRYACVGCSAPVQRGDVALFAYPNDRTMIYVKRVVALPGDRVLVRGAEVRVNGEPFSVPPAADPPAAELAAARVPPGSLPAAQRPAELDLSVPPGHVFVLGDRREASTDSRDFGAVPLQDVVGRARQVWFSWGADGVRWERLGHVVR